MYEYEKMKIFGSRATVVNIGSQSVAIGKRCPICGYHVRGLFHEKGTHHRILRPERRENKKSR